MKLVLVAPILRDRSGLDVRADVETVLDIVVPFDIRDG